MKWKDQIGSRRHFTDAGSVLIFGGGFKKGYLHGTTAGERPCKTIEKPVHIEDLHPSPRLARGSINHIGSSS